MTTYKFTRRGGRALFSDFVWPLPAAATPGAWVEVAEPLKPCRHGLHVCRSEDLPYWLHDELWQVETEGRALPSHDGLVVARARLVQKIEVWDDARHGFANQCLERARARQAQRPPDERWDVDRDLDIEGYLGAATHCAQTGNVLVAAYASALAFTCFVPREQAKAAFRAERLQQAQLLAALLGLTSS